MDKKDLEEQLANNDAVMVYFSGNDCGVCKALQPKIETLFSTKFPKIKQVYIKSEEYRDTAAQLNVLSIPTIIVYFENKEFLRQSRLISIQDIEQRIIRTYNLFFN